MHDLYIGPDRNLDGIIVPRALWRDNRGATIFDERDEQPPALSGCIVIFMQNTELFKIMQCDGIFPVSEIKKWRNLIFVQIKNLLRTLIH